MSYKLPSIFRTAFGINAPIYVADVYSNQQSPALNYSDVKFVDDQQSRELSWLGTPIMFPIKIHGGSYQFYNPKGELISETIADFQMPASSLVDFSRAKNITRTDVLGNNGTVKEIYGFDDWSIRIRGLCLNEPGVRTAEEQKQALLRIEQIAGAVDVLGSLFTEKNIHAITIESIDFQQVQGKPDVIPFEIRAISDEPLLLTLDEFE
ncbi:DUF6046 domain-containing protein [Faecalibacter macacae]|uniref:DUF6046 domain-containing protein n=1 Tax=Faecalibacter macacae TaxID=1859289 RepID=A0A3L9M726_9FLAO|nr:DUF6046 domain-containing protein [Faecalibacter macacae]RLZ08601.1 hypothetical protein EAH69_09820 [Faecalibacter macacae]